MGKFINQARLPRGAYDAELSLEGSLWYFKKKAEEKKRSKMEKKKK